MEALETGRLTCDSALLPVHRSEEPAAARQLSLQPESNEGSVESRELLAQVRQLQSLDRQRRRAVVDRWWRHWRGRRRSPTTEVGINAVYLDVASLHTHGSPGLPNRIVMIFTCREILTYLCNLTIAPNCMAV